jgi:hypothetical protein
MPDARTEPEPRTRSGLDANTERELARLRRISSAVTEFDADIRSDAFARLAATPQTSSARVAVALGAVITGVVFAAITAAWYERHAGFWRRVWHWLDRGPAHPVPLVILVGVLAACVAALLISGFSPVGKVPSLVAAVAGGISALAAATFALYPNLVPSTERSFTISNVRLERSVTLGQYMNLTDVAQVLGYDRDVRFPKPGSMSLSQQGFVIDFAFQTKGLRNQSVGLRWMLFNGSTGSLFRQSEPQTDVWCLYEVNPTQSPCLLYGSHLKDLDVGSFGLWVANAPPGIHRRQSQAAIVSSSGRPVECVVARVEAYDENGGDRLAYGDSPAFPGVPGSRVSCRSAAGL